MNRREMLLTTGAGAAALLLPKFTLAEEPLKPAYSLPKLPYEYDALEPVIDKMTMTIHHTKHHQTYIDNLNKIVKDAPDLAKPSIDEVLLKYKDAPETIRTGVINNGGGHANHTFFWNIMAPRNQGGGPSANLAAAITSFGGMEKLKEEVLKAALGRFGSGWAWVIVGKEGKLEVNSTPNQNTPLMDGQKPILGIDVWEHAYYLKYQNRRADYVKTWWDVANWKTISENFETAMKG